MRHSQIAYQYEQLLLKAFFDSVISLESDKMTALSPNDCLTFTLYETFSLSWTTFLKEGSWFDD